MRYLLREGTRPASICPSLLAMMTPRAYLNHKVWTQSSS